MRYSDEFTYSQCKNVTSVSGHGHRPGSQVRLRTRPPAT